MVGMVGVDWFESGWLGLAGVVLVGVDLVGMAPLDNVGQQRRPAWLKLNQSSQPAGWHSAGLCRQMPAPTNLLMSSGARWVLTPVGPALEGGTRMVGLAWASHPLHSKRSDEHRGRGHRLGMVTIRMVRHRPVRATAGLARLLHTSRGPAGYRPSRSRAQRRSRHAKFLRSETERLGCDGYN